MPIASSSRNRINNRSRRELPPDNIEGDEPSQQAGVDNVDEDEDGGDVQPRRPKQVKKEKAVKDRRRVTNVQEESDRENLTDEDDPIDVENFPNHPLDKKDSHKFVGMAQDWMQIRKEIHQSSYSLVKDVGVATAEMAEEQEEANKALVEVENIMKDLVDIEEEMVANERAIEDIHQGLVRGEVIDNVVGRYKESVTKRIQDYSKKTSRQKYAKNEQFAAFKQGVWEVNSDQPMPPVTEFMPKEAGDDSDDDDELEMGGVTQDYKCPLSLTILVDPMTSKACGHSFSANSIRDFLGNHVKPCPASGCHKSISMKDLKPDKNLAKRVRAVERRAQRRASDNDAEEIVE